MVKKSEYFSGIKRTGDIQVHVGNHGKLPAHPDDKDNNNSVPNSCTGS